MKESPLFSKTFDLTKWLIENTARFPRNQRAVLAKRIEDAVLRFYEHILRAAKIAADRSESLEEANFELERLKLYLRLAADLQFLSLRQYEFSTGMVVEIGRLLGGWMKKQSVTDDKNS